MQRGKFVTGLKGNRANGSPAVLVFSFLLLLAFSGAAHAVVFVNASAPGPTHDGTSWANAYTTLQDALVPATSGTEIWVAKGIYYPDEGNGQTNNNRNASFILKPGVGVFGGFAGTETQRAQRNWITNLTILSGNITQNDTTDADGIVVDWQNIVGQDNAYNVVYGENLDTGTALDGFTVTAGCVDSTYTWFICGGGLWVFSSNLVLRNLVFSGNAAVTGAGGAIYFWEGSPTITDSKFIGNMSCQAGAMYCRDTGSGSVFERLVFINNDAYSSGCGTAAISGGGIYCTGSNTFKDIEFISNTAAVSGGGMECFNPIILQNATFTGNHCDQYGGGFWDGGNSSLTDVTFTGNSADDRGGAVASNGSNIGLYKNVNFLNNSCGYAGGAFYFESTGINLVDSVISGNSASYGGGAWKYYGTLNMTNVVLSGNSASSGGGIYGYLAAVNMDNVTISGNRTDALTSYDTDWTLENSVIWGNSGSSYNDSGSSSFSTSYSTIQGGCPSGATCGAGMIYSDPLFVSPIDPSIAPTTSGNFRLNSGSTAINMGSNALLPADIADLDNDADVSETLPYDLDDNPRIVNTTVDMGAYEWGTFVPPPPVADGKTAGTAARFVKNSTTPTQIDVTYDTVTCAGDKAAILYGSIGDYSSYDGCAQNNAGAGGTATIDSSLLNNVWFNIIWTTGTTGGHPGYGWNGTANTERTFPAAGFCGITTDNHTNTACD